MKRKRTDIIRITSWNVAGLNACLKKGFTDYVATEAADILMIQETKLSTDPNIPINYKFKYYNHCTNKKGYSGVAVFSNMEPLNVSYSIGHLDDEGRYIILEFQSFFLINAYVPNASEGLKRLDEKRKHVSVLQDFMANLKKPIIWGGDLNVAHTENDLARPKTNLKTPGFTPEERQDFSRAIETLDLIDTFRHCHPKTFDRYTYYSYRFNCRQKNLGWRLDYFLVSKCLLDRVISADIRSDVQGSDHLPIILELSDNA